MKKLVPILAAVMVMAGCSTTSNSTATLADTELAVSAAASTATALVVHNNPSYAPDFQLGAQVLNTLASGTNSINMADVGGTLASAGETNAAVLLVITAAVTTAETIVNQQTNPIVQQQWAAGILGATASGIASGNQLAPMAAHAPAK